MKMKMKNPIKKSSYTSEYLGVKNAQSLNDALKNTLSLKLKFRKEY